MPVSKLAAVIPPRAGGISGFPAPYWGCAGAAMYLGDVRACLRAMPSRSVHCCVTSPPYWGLRRYLEEGHKDAAQEIGAEPSPDCGTQGRAQCGRCFVCSMVGAFREVYRVLRDDGTAWLNLGDTFDNGQLLVPARVALALATDGWKLVQDIIWYSPNKMPESVTNRCAKSHEHIFLLAKGGNYYYFDNTSIMVDGSGTGGGNTFSKNGGDQHRTYDRPDYPTANKRDVWVVPTQGYPGAHFAVYSPRLITPCILAGTSEHGCCADCGRPYERVVVRVGAVKVDGDIMDTTNIHRDRSIRDNRNGVDSTLDTGIAQRETVGWRKACGCRTDEVVPAVVLDPFVGSGTTVATALQLGRAGVGIDLSETYLRENAVPRIEAAMRGEKVPRKATAAVVPDAPPVPRKLR